MTFSKLGFFQINIFDQPDKGEGLRFNRVYTKGAIYNYLLQYKTTSFYSLKYYCLNENKICHTPLSWLNSYNYLPKITVKHLTRALFKSELNRKLQTT